MQQAKFETTLGIIPRNIITLTSAVILLAVFLFLPWAKLDEAGTNTVTGFELLNRYPQSFLESLSVALPLIAGILGILGVLGYLAAPQHEKWFIRLSTLGGLLGTAFFAMFFARNGADVVEAGIVQSGFWIALVVSFVLLVFPLASLPIALLLPSLTILVLFLYYPTLQTFSLSTYRKSIRVGAPAHYVGLDNFARLLDDQTYLDSLKTTAFISCAIVFIGLAISLGIAVLAMQKVRGATIYRTLLIWPYALSPAIAGAIFLVLFNEQAGLMRYLTDTLFGIKPKWLSSPDWAPWIVIMAAIWKNLGYNILFYMAGLQNVSGEVLEAASIDGANRWKRFWFVTFPLISPMTFFLLLTNLTHTFFDIFGLIDILTPGGGPIDSTNVLIYRVYQDAFEFRKFGPAAAQSVVLFALVIGITLLQFRFGARRVHYGA